MTGVLTAAGIPASKLGEARRVRLSPAERELYFWVLRRFAIRGRPSGAETREAAASRALDPDSALATLAREDLVHLDRSGEIAVAYPFSGTETAHRVRFPGGHEAYAMCALDALGIAPMFDQPIAISSHDPVSGEEVLVRLAPSGDGDWSPTSSVVVAGATGSQGDSCQSCCPVLNFFASAANAERWLDQHPRVRAHVVSMRDAIVAGRAVFGGVLEKG